MNEHILVTGGAGYIGSHTCVALLNAGYTGFADHVRRCLALAEQQPARVWSLMKTFCAYETLSPRKTAVWLLAH